MVMMMTTPNSCLYLSHQRNPCHFFNMTLAIMLSSPQPRTSSHPYPFPHHRTYLFNNTNLFFIFTHSHNFTFQTLLHSYFYPWSRTYPTRSCLDVRGQALLGGGQMCVKTLSLSPFPSAFLSFFLFLSQSHCEVCPSIYFSLIPSQLLSWTWFPVFLHYDSLLLSHSFFFSFFFCVSLFVFWVFVRQSFSDVRGQASLGGG